MNKEDMCCHNCIFINRTSGVNYCAVSANSIVDDDNDHVIDFPIILYSRRMWCGQGEWEGPAKDNPDIKVLYRWGEWDN
jgi:hypothetical protein